LTFRVTVLLTTSTIGGSINEEVVMAEKREVLSGDAEDRIERAEEVAEEAKVYWQTALRGLFALPNAAALSLTSAVLYSTGAFERSYRRLEQLTGKIGESVSRELNEVRKTATLPEPERPKKQPSA
jgi:hypothetical protein